MSLAGDHQLVASLGDGESGGCVRCSGTNSRPSAWSWLQWNTTDHRHQDRGGGARGEVRRAKETEAPSSPPGALPVVRGGAQWSAAGQPGRVARGTGQGSAAHRRADCRDLRCCSDARSRCSCAADVGPVGGRPPGLRHVSACCCRAGYQSAQYFSREQHPAARCAAGAAIGGTVGGSAVSQSFVYHQFTEQHVDIPVPGVRGLLDGGGLQGLLPEQSPAARWVNDGDLQGFLQDRVPQLLLEWIALLLRMSRFKWRFLTFLRPKKSAKVAAHSSAELGAHSSSPTLSSHQMAPAAPLEDSPTRDDIQVMVTSEEQAYHWNRLTRTSHCQMPPGRRPGWMRSIDGLSVHLETQEVVQELYACFPG